MRTPPCKSKSCVEGRLFTVNTHRSLRVGQTTVLRHDCIWKIAYWEGFVS